MLTSTKEAKACAAVVANSKGVEIQIEYSVTIEDRAPEVEITKGEDSLAPQEGDASAPPEAPKPAAEGEGCRPHAEAEARIADCGKIIDDKDRDRRRGPRR